MHTPNLSYHSTYMHIKSEKLYIPHNTCVILNSYAAILQGDSIFISSIKVQVKGKWWDSVIAQNHETGETLVLLPMDCVIEEDLIGIIYVSMDTGFRFVREDVDFLRSFITTEQLN